MQRSLDCPRRKFLARCCAFGAVASALGSQTEIPSASSRNVDRHLVVLLSGVRLNAVADGVDGLCDLGKRLNAILAMQTLPAHCLVLPDGETAISNDAVARFCRTFSDAGIDPVVAEKGNVRVVHSPDCDLMLLDDEQGMLTPSVQDFLASELPRWERPLFICAAHPPQWIRHGQLMSLMVKGRPLESFLASVPYLAGYLHGESHRWLSTCENMGRGVFTPMLSLPAAESWGDIGHVLLRTSPGGAVAELRQDGFRPRFHPSADDGIRTNWNAMVAANSGAKCRFSWAEA